MGVKPSTSPPTSLKLYQHVNGFIGIFHEKLLYLMVTDYTPTTMLYLGLVITIRWNILNT